MPVAICTVPTSRFTLAWSGWQQVLGSLVPGPGTFCRVLQITQKLAPIYNFLWKPWHDESSAWFPTLGPLKSVFQIFLFLPVFLIFFFPELACFAKTEKRRQKFLLFFKIYHDIKTSVLKMVPAEFPGVHFLPLLSINQTHCRLVGVLAPKYRIRHSETFLRASKASHRSWLLPCFTSRQCQCPGLPFH